MQYRYGFSAELVVELLRIQAGACAICTVLLQRGSGPRGVHRDHCHVTGQPRGLLCRACNICLGFYEAHQRPAGLRIEPYEGYLSNREVVAKMALTFADRDPVLRLTDALGRLQAGTGTRSLSPPNLETSRTPLVKRRREPCSYNVSARFTEAEVKLVEECALEDGMSKSAWIRKQILEDERVRDEMLLQKPVA